MQVDLNYLKEWRILSDLRGFLAAGVGLGPNTGVDLASKHLSSELRLYDIAGQSAQITGDRLRMLLERRPKLIVELLSTVNSDVHTMERVLRVPHKPSTQAAHKVSLHPEPLSDFALQYIVDHGGKAAYTNLVERQGGRLPTSTLLHLQDILFHKHKSLVFVAPAGARMHAAKLARGWRKITSNSVQLLSQVTDAHRRPKGFEQTRREILMCAVALGVPIPASCLREDESVPSATDLLGGLIDDEALIDVRGHHDRSANFLIGHHREVMKLYASLPHAKQVQVFWAAACWQLVDRAQDPAQLWIDCERPGSYMRNATSGYVPSYRAVRALPVSRIVYLTSTAAIPTIYRLLENTLGDDHYAWVTFESLYEEWTGTFGELVDTVMSMH